MSDHQTAYVASAKITITLNSLAAGAMRQSDVIDNGTGKNLDVLVGGVITTGAALLPGDDQGYVNLYAFGTADSDQTPPNYTANAGAADAAFTGVRGDLVYLGRAHTPAAATAYAFGPFSIANAFRGSVPQKFGIVLENRSGAALKSSGNEARYTGVYRTDT